MSSLQTKAKSSDRASLNTTIDREVFNEFKASCKKSGIPMNTLIESFMRQYSAGEFYLKFGKTRMIEVELNENNSNEIVEE